MCDGGHTDDDPETVADAELQAPAGRGSISALADRVFSRRAAPATARRPRTRARTVRVSAHDLMIFAVQDPSEKRQDELGFPREIPAGDEANPTSLLRLPSSVGDRRKDVETKILEILAS